MKKIAWILMINIILVATSVVHAEEAGSGSETTGTCTNGRVVTGLNGHAYCQSKEALSWYAAMAWCQAQKRRLVTVYEACDVDPSRPVPSKSKNFDDERFAGCWTSSNKDASKAYRVHNNRVVTTDERIYYTHALCW